MCQSRPKVRLISQAYGANRSSQWRRIPGLRGGGTAANTGPPARVAYGAPRPNRPSGAGFGQRR